MNQIAHENTLDQEKYIGFQVDGKIINELSKQVSSHLFALGELLKNSYDAQATNINITLDMQKSILIVEDNGLGISLNNIRSIFHIAKSEKTYGKESLFINKKLKNKSKNGSYLFIHKIEKHIKQNNILFPPQGS